MANVKQKTTEVITVTGSGTQKKQAFASALNSIHNKMLQSSNDVIVRIEPIDIEMLEATATHETERFLFFFFKRDKVTYQVKLNVTIELTKIVVENIAFKERQKNVYQNFSLRKRKQKQEIT